MNIKIMSFIFLILLISGCSDGGSNNSGGTSAVGNKDTMIIASDILSITSFDISPPSPLLPDRPFSLLLQTENIGKNHVTLKVDDGGSEGDMVLINSCSDIFDIKNYKTNPDVGTLDEIDIKPMGVQNFEWKMMTPSDDLFSGTGTSCNFEIQLLYDAMAETNTYVYFATPFEIMKSFYSKQNMYLLGSNLATDGPLKVNVNTDSEQPIMIDAYGWTITVNIENVGDGLATVESLKLIVPDGISYTSGPGFCELDRVENLEIKSGGSEPIPCLLSPPSEKVLIATAYKIKAEVKYAYVIQDSIQINVESRI